MSHCTVRTSSPSAVRRSATLSSSGSFPTKRRLPRLVLVSTVAAASSSSAPPGAFFFSFFFFFFFFFDGDSFPSPPPLSPSSAASSGPRGRFLSFWPRELKSGSMVGAAYFWRQSSHWSLPHMLAGPRRHAAQTMTGTAQTIPSRLTWHLYFPRYTSSGARQTTHFDSTSATSAAAGFSEGTCARRRSKT